MEKTELISSKPILPLLLRLAAPNMLGNIIQASLSFIEAWRLGFLGAGALAAVALVFPLYMLSMMWSAGAIGGAVAGAAARAHGAGDRAAGEAVLRSALVIAVFGGVLMGGAVFLGAAPLISILGGSGQVHGDAVSYGRTLFAGIILFWLFNLIASVCRGTGDMRTPFFAIIVMALVYGFASGPLIDTFGIRGSAFGLLLGFGAALIVVTGAILLGRTPVRFALGAVPLKVIFPILRNGLVAASQSIATIAAAMIVTGYMAQFGATALAGYGIGVRLELLLIPIIFGFGGAAIAVTGANVGAGQRQRAVRAGWLAAGLATATLTLIGAVVAFWPEIWRGWFSTDAAVIQVTDQYLQFVGPFYGFFGLGLCLYFSSQGLNSLFWPVFGNFLRLGVVAVGIALLPWFGAASLHGLLWVVVAGMVVYGVAVALGLKLFAWRL